MLTPSRRLPLLIYIVASILVIGFAYTQIRVPPVGAEEPGFPVTIEWSQASLDIELFLVSSIVIFALGVIMIYWAGSPQKFRMEKDPSDPDL